MGEKVAFRRIHGHIVPIRVKDDQAKELAKSAGLVGAGLATSVATGLATAALDVRNQKLRGFAMSAASRADRLWNAERGFTAIKAAQRSEKIFERASMVAKFGTRINALGLAAGAALIGAGIHKALSQTRYKDDAEAKALASTAAGTAASFAVRNVYHAKYAADIGAFSAVSNAAKMAARKLIKLI